MSWKQVSIALNSEQVMIIMKRLIDSYTSLDRLLYEENRMSPLIVLTLILKHFVQIFLIMFQARVKTLFTL